MPFEHRGDARVGGVERDQAIGDAANAVPTAEGARQVSKVSNEAKAGAEKSGNVVRQAVKAMSQIEKSSEQIGQIIGVTKERVRQIQNKALEKIRIELEESFIEGKPRKGLGRAEAALN